MKLRVSINGRSYEVEVEVLDRAAPALRLANVRVERLTADGRAVASAPAPASAAATVGGVPTTSSTDTTAQTPARSKAQRTPERKTAPAARARSRKSNVAGTWRGVGMGDRGEMCAPVPGIVKAIHVKPGDAVKAGQRLLTLEVSSSYSTASPPLAGTVRALVGGVVRRLHIQKGDAVATGQVLVTIE